MTDSNQNKMINDPLILGLEASGEHASVALVQKGTIVAKARLDQRHGHASHFVTLAANCVKEAGISFSDLTHIAAGVGPGSFTGLRVCLSAAKGFVLAGNLVGIGVHGLRARAFAALTDGRPTQHPDKPIISCADTRRGVYFHQIYNQALEAESSIGESDLSQLLAKQDAYNLALPPAELSEENGADGGTDGGTDGEAHRTEMNAGHIALLAEKDIAQNLSNLAGLDPLYVAAPKLGPAKKG